MKQSNARILDTLLQTIIDDEMNDEITNGEYPLNDESRNLLEVKLRGEFETIRDIVESKRINCIRGFNQNYQQQLQEAARKQAELDAIKAKELEEAEDAAVEAEAEKDSED